ncbi:hypothetical protein D3C79_677040 [compost metagenome]
MPFSYQRIVAVVDDDISLVSHNFGALKCRVDIGFDDDGTAQVTDPIDRGRRRVGGHDNSDVGAKDLRSLGNGDTKIAAAHRDKSGIVEIAFQAQELVEHSARFKGTAKLGIFKLQENRSLNLFGQSRSGNGWRTYDLPC